MSRISLLSPVCHRRDPRWGGVCNCFASLASLGGGSDRSHGTRVGD